ncbi:MAG: acyl carrier protein [Lachnospiraceae bacterium]|nr:acyl carrier protein [Lachnospiraceae bacterium]
MFEKVKAIVVETINCNPDDVKLESLLQEDLEMDSLDAVQLNMSIEEELGIAIPDEVLTELKSIKDIVEYLENNGQ